MFAAFETAWANDDFEALFSMLAALRPAVDELFDKVMVMCEDPDLRANRLNMLKALTLRMERLADFRRCNFSPTWLPGLVRPGKPSP